MENYIPVSNAILSYCIYPYLTPNELHRTNVLELYYSKKQVRRCHLV